jgi:hypothetical protein
MIKLVIGFFKIVVFFILLSGCSETKQTVRAVGTTTENVTNDVVGGAVNTVDAILP